MKHLCLFFMLHSIVTRPSQVITVFAHGFLSNGQAAYRYKKRDLIKNKVHAFNFKDTENPYETCLAGESDVYKLAAIVENVQRNHNALVEILAVSRGAATACKFVATTNPVQQAGIAALIVESPFARYSHVVKSAPHHARTTAQEKLGPLSYLTNPLIYLIQFPLLFTSDDTADHAMKFALPNSEPRPSPLDVIAQIPDSIPVFFFCSEGDSLIPVNSTKELYEELKRSGHPKTHIFVTKQGKHAKLMYENHQDCFLVLNAFRQHYNLPHFTLTKAQQVRAYQLFLRTQPEIESKHSTGKEHTGIELLPMGPYH